MKGGTNAAEQQPGDEPGFFFIRLLIYPFIGLRTVRIAVFNPSAAYLPLGGLLPDEAGG